MSKVLAFIKKLLFGSLSILLFFIIWEAASRLNIINSAVVPAPTTIFLALKDAAISGDLFRNFGISLQRVASGFAIALLVSIPLGFLLGTFFKNVERALLPFLKMLEKLNPFALFPVFMIFFGIGSMEKIAIIFWVAQFPLLFHTIVGAKAVDVLLLKSAHSMGASKREIFLKVILPSAVPYIFTGIKIAAQIAFFMIIASEYAGSSEGLGWFYLSSNQTYQINLSYGIVIFITIMSILVNVLFTKLEKHFLVWKESSFQ